MRFALGEKVTFAEEPETPYTIKAISAWFAIMTRPMTSKDARVFEYEESLDGVVVYTIVDRRTMMRGPNDFILNPYNYTRQQDIDHCLRDLDDGRAHLSMRRSVSVLLVDG